MTFIKDFTNKSRKFLFWIVISSTVGIVTGVVGAIFHKAIDFATTARGAHPWLLYLLPAGGVAIAMMYRLSKKYLSTNTVIECIRNNERASGLLAPFIFIGAFITHLLGGSAGREGAALQIGGGIGSNMARAFRMNKHDAGIMIVCGMSGAFSAIFTTPVTATIFALELVSVGHIRYFQLLPCAVSSICGYLITLALGNHRLFYELSSIPGLDIIMCGKVIILGIAAAFLSIAFCLVLHKSEEFMTKIFKKDYIKAFAGGCIIIILTLLAGTYDYNGAGMNIINNALSGNAKPEAFVLKLLFTAVTVGAGFKGGEIVPAFFVGSTFGAVAGYLLGIDPSFAAALSMVCIFCGIANCPIASIMLGIELFGSSGIIYFTLVSGLAFVVAGHFGLYKSQKIVYATLGTDKENNFVK